MGGTESGSRGRQRRSERDDRGGGNGSVYENIRVYNTLRGSLFSINPTVSPLKIEYHTNYIPDPLL